MNYIICCFKRNFKFSKPYIFVGFVPFCIDLCFDIYILNINLFKGTLYNLEISL